jgi:outer membrane lipoprotein
MMKKLECRSVVRAGTWLGLVLFMAQVSGCASSPVPKSLRQQAALQPVSFFDLKLHPSLYRDRIVILGGDIVKTRHLGRTSEIEVIQMPLDCADRPRRRDRSGGRFLIECPYFLEPTIYEEGRRLTVAGKVLGMRTQKLDEAEYDYLVIGCDHLHLWPVRVVRHYPYAWHGWGWGPGWGPGWHGWGWPYGYGWGWPYYYWW